MRNILIIVLILVILLLGGAWIYLLLNGAPEGVDDIRKNLFGGDTITTTPGPAPEIIEVPAEETTISTEAILIQITDRAVAGAVITEIASSTVVRYVEKGTGHIYELSLDDGVVRRVSGATVPGAAHAVWSPSGSHFVLMNEVNGAPRDLLIGTIHQNPDQDEYVVDTESLSADPQDVAFSKDGKNLYFTRRSVDGTVGFSRSIDIGTETKVFSVPMRDMSVLWDLWNAKAHMVYTRPAEGYMGYLYTIVNGALQKEAEGTGLTAVRTDNRTVLVSANGGASLLRIGERTGSTMPIAPVREKCDAGIAIWCAASGTSTGFPVPWYQGLVSYNDTIYRIDLATGESTSILELETYAREQLDVTGLMAGAGDRLLFTNKRDDSLWLANPALVTAN